MKWRLYSDQNKNKERNRAQYVVICVLRIFKASNEQTE